MLGLSQCFAVAGEDSAFSKKFNLQGDTRFRIESSQGQDALSVPGPARWRNRIRFRLGLEAYPSKKTTLQVSVASGGNDPRSSNVTLENTFETLDLRLDLISATFRPNIYWELGLGKFRNKALLWKPADLLWDSDLSLNGGYIKLSRQTGPIDLSLALGALVLDENPARTDDPLLFPVQLTLETLVQDSSTFILALTYYNFENLQGWPKMAYSSSGNLIDAFGNIAFDFDSVGVGLEWKGISVGPLVMNLLGEFIYNPDQSKISQALLDSDTGYLVGLAYGHADIRLAHEWKIQYMYRSLESNAWPDFLPDSDAYGGDTGIRGHEIIFKYGLGLNTQLGLDYYRTGLITSDVTVESNREHLFQLDLLLNF